jgi:uncharacterized membrane protein
MLDVVISEPIRTRTPSSLVQKKRRHGAWRRALREEDGGIDFGQRLPPAYSDFAFLPFAIGMTLGAAEISPINPHVGKVALGHALLSYVFGTGVLAVAINRVTNLGQ